MLERGVLAGYRIQDCAVEVHFGKYHDVDSSEAAFKTAARHAFKKAFLAARPSLLEPIVKLEITVPSKYTGAILGDLPTKRAHVENQDSLPGDMTVIYARAPAGGGGPVRGPARRHDAGHGVVRDGTEPLRDGAAQRAAADRQQGAARRTRRRSDGFVPTL